VRSLLHSPRTPCVPPAQPSDFPTQFRPQNISPSTGGAGGCCCAMSVVIRTIDADNHAGDLPVGAGVAQSIIHGVPSRAVDYQKVRAVPPSRPVLPNHGSSTPFDISCETGPDRGLQVEELEVKRVAPAPALGHKHPKSATLGRKTGEGQTWLVGCRWPGGATSMSCRVGKCNYT
jgi:hypothetical protein